MREYNIRQRGEFKTSDNLNEIPQFKPSMKLATKIMRELLKINSVGRTTLAQRANVNYSEMLKHLEWMEKNM